MMSWGVAVVMASLLRRENLIRVYQSYILRLGAVAARGGRGAGYYDGRTA